MPRRGAQHQAAGYPFSLQVSGLPVSLLDFLSSVYPWKILLRPQDALKDNADVVKKFIFRYLDLPLTNGSRNILVNITDKDILIN
jgi:hypothetical protein